MSLLRELGRSVRDGEYLCLKKGRKWILFLWIRRVRFLWEEIELLLISRLIILVVLSNMQWSNFDKFQPRIRMVSPSKKSSISHPLVLGCELMCIRPYLIDLESTNGTMLNGERIEERRYYEIRSEDMVKFGESTREYVFIKDPSVQ